ncbi:MAG: PilZ domain-containing protein [Planctomycetes bacterium]|nr:PilZ domain-containing protein [Planctomycetota bacterium]
MKMEDVMDNSERRKAKRLSAKFNLSCSKMGATSEQNCSGRTVNVSPGGLYFETAAEVMFDVGNLIKIELAIPPTSGELELGGRISVLGKVVRTCDVEVEAISILSPNKHGVALEFCHSPRLAT